jgi:exonuclease SbcC
MIPIHLRISGFLSYYDPVELDFNAFDLACISGQNGAGKSSLLDALTWVLFGEARGKSSDVIHLNQNVKAAEVALSFSYEGNVFRVLRTLPRGKSGTLEFQIQDGERWKPLTEKSTRETQARIEQTLRLDYETFINASFFLQGKADQFTQKKSSERKTILSSILGLEIWDVYKERAADKRKAIESEVSEIDGRVSEIEAELAEEGARKTRLAELQKTLKRLSAAREAQESALENVKRNAALINEQRKLVAVLFDALEKSRADFSSIEKRLAEKESERATYADLLARAKEIESAYKQWQKIRVEVEKMNQVAAQFREHDEKRQPLLREIEVERAKLGTEAGGISNQLLVISNQLLVIGELNEKIEGAKKSLAEVEEKLRERGALEVQRNEAREKFAMLKAENETLRKEMDEIKKRIDSLEATQDATCPVCGQELSESHRASTLAELHQEGKEMGDRFRANKKEMEESEKQVADLEAGIAKLSAVENERVKFSSEISQLTERIETLESVAKEKVSGEKRLKEIEKILADKKYAVAAQKELAKLDKELAKLGYDASAHDAKRSEEIVQREIDEDYRKLDKARDVKKQIDGEIARLEDERGKRKEEIVGQEDAHEKAARALAESESLSPDLNKAERELFALREDENRTRDEVGAARQKVDVLDTLRERKKDYAAQREEHNQQIRRYKTLERAFGKDGAPALLIEQALPQIEEKANDLLDRLSDGQMSVRFVTQAEYKDKKRDDLKETLEIQISDSAGMRAYEMYSGGEAFRINFAIRLALSEILAQRKGARLQTLVIDEGFGSQDAQGRQRLIEAINLVKKDFAKILVVTHLDELKDAFPNRIEVEKTARGSVAKVV